MRIAQVAPLIEDVPPRQYGGTERVVSYLTEELVNLGHSVTLFASATSITSAMLAPVVPTALRSSEEMNDPIPHYMVLLDQLQQRLDDFDILHFHFDALHYPVMRPHADRVLTTLHGRQDLPDLARLYSEFPELKLVSISNAQRAPIPDANFIATVYHGLPIDLYRPTLRQRGSYLAFLGRIAPEKSADVAIDIACRAGMELKVAAKVDGADEAYFQAEIEPLLRRPGIDFIGEIGDDQKETFLGEAAALLLPISWPEPFGLVMIESMACGTPVLAFRAGSVPEVIDHGLSGMVVDTADEAVSAIPHLLEFERRTVRDCFERRFTSRRMAQDYVRVYEQLLTHPEEGVRDALGGRP
jgi:glycosyltransferase involved in cell wall biosynthesis